MTYNEDRRTYYPNIDAAMDALGVHVEDRRQLRSAVEPILATNRGIYITPSGGHITILGPDYMNPEKTARIGYVYYTIAGFINADGTYTDEVTAAYRDRTPGWRAGANRFDDDGPVCPRCNMVLPKSGRCCE